MPHTAQIQTHLPIRENSAAPAELGELDCATAHYRGA